MLHLRSDHWTSPANQSYITVLREYIDKNWNMQSVVLATRKTEKRHTGVNIASDMTEIAKEFEIK